MQRILSSEGFRRSKKLAVLLEYLVGEVLEGRGDRIKATSIAIDVFGRDETFDQQRDTIVRVEAGRVRRQLREYYAGEGLGDPIRIEIPKGNYQPVITPIETTVPARAVDAPPAKDTLTKGHRWIGITLAVLVVAASLTWVISIARQDLPGEQIGDPPHEFSAQSVKPFVMVLPMTSLGADPGAGQIALGTVESVITNLAKLSGLSVMAHGSILGLDQPPGAVDLLSIREKLGVTHVLQGAVDQENDTVVVNVRLVETDSGEVIWAERFSDALASRLSLEEELALRIASELSVQIQPDERQRLADQHTSSPEAWTLYRQGLVMLIPPNDRTRIETARNLFRRAGELDPDFAGGYAGESFSHSITILFLKASSPEQELARALPLARRAIQLDPSFGMGYATLSFAQIFAEDLEQAMRNARAAVTIQPGDAFAQFILGMNLIIAGQPGEAVPVLEGALRLDPLESRTPYLNVLAIGQYAARQYGAAVESLDYNLSRGGPRGPHMDVFRSAALAQLGEIARATEIFQEMRLKYPDFPFQAWLSNWLSRTDQLEDTLQLLDNMDTKAATPLSLQPVRPNAS